MSPISLIRDFVVLRLSPSLCSRFLPRPLFLRCFQREEEIGNWLASQLRIDLRLWIPCFFHQRLKSTLGRCSKRCRVEVGPGGRSVGQMLPPNRTSLTQTGAILSNIWQHACFLQLHAHRTTHVIYRTARASVQNWRKKSHLEDRPPVAPLSAEPES